MSKTIYALLVGINNYPAPLSQLRGCVNDINAFEAFLQTRCNSEEFSLNSKVLLDSFATRNEVIEQFTSHLGKAGKGDIAIFYYSGHGSQSTTPPELWPYEADHQNETLVLYDSRQPGSWDLADKELAYLIEKISSRCTDVVIVLDCCHSGSGTRNIDEEEKVRYVTPDERLRPYESYLISLGSLSQSRTGEDSKAGLSGWQLLPHGRHILMAACRDVQKAKEYFADGKNWGAFSYFLRTALELYQGDLTYRQVFQYAKARISANIFDQSPQLEASQSEDLEKAFLGGAIHPKRNYFTVSFNSKSWQINGGAVHGLPAPKGEETTYLAIYPIQKVSSLGAETNTALGKARVISVEVDFSVIELLDGLVLEPNQVYEAIITDVPLPKLEVSLLGDSQGLELIRKKIINSLYIGLAKNNPSLQLIARNGGYLIILNSDQRLLLEAAVGYTPDGANRIVEYLEHISRWITTIELRNPHSLIPNDGLKVTISQEGKEIDDPEILLEYSLKNDKWVQPTYQIRIQNNFIQPLYCAVYGIWESFGIEATFFEEGGIIVYPGENNAVLSKLMYASVPQKLWEKGITERRDIIKVIASTVPFETSLLVQDRLEVPRNRQANQGPNGFLEAIMNRIQTRESDYSPENISREDWTTKEIIMKVRKPLNCVSIQKEGSSISLGCGVRIKPHPELAANVRLASILQTERALGNQPSLPDLGDSSLLFFNNSRGGDPGLAIIELNQVENHFAVTPTQPLQVIIDRPLGENEFWLPIAYDGEFYFPLGYAKQLGNQSEIVIERLPAPRSANSRDLPGSICIFIQKIGHQVLDLPYSYPILAIAEIDDSNNVSYKSYRTSMELVEFRRLVDNSQRITLFIHGITGETRTMVRTAKQYLKDDLLLTFDYENINTPVEEVARSLKRRLEEVGLGPGNTKDVRIVAHSLGGLVSRWFIEHEGGNKFVQELVLLGTPNAGSPIPTVQEWATIVLTFAINHLAPNIWALGAVGTLLGLIEKIDVTLDQLKPDSDLLKNLAGGIDPKIPYFLIAGNTSLLSESMAKDISGKTAFERIVCQLGYDAMSLALFFQKPNDIAVSVESVFALPHDREPKPETIVIPCDHTSYFTSSESIAVLQKVLK